MKILLFNAPITFNSWQSTEAPMGVAYIAALLKKNGHEVRIKDFDVERFSRKCLFDLVDEFRPDLAGVSFRTPSFASAKVICSTLKERNRSLPIVLGGPHATAFPEETLRSHDADMVVRGEGEFAMLEIADALNGNLSLEKIKGLTYKINGNIYHNEARQLLDQETINKLPWPARELLPMERYNINVVLSSRGCPFACIYCDKIISSRKIKLRSSEDVAAEIIFIMEKYKKSAFYFIDEHFLANKERDNHILDLILKARKDTGMDFKWICQTRVDAIDERILRKAKETGCREVHFGLETGDETELAFINKRTTLKKAEEAVRIAKRCGIHIRGNFMIGFPISTHQTIRNSIRFAKSLPIDRYRFFIVSPLPNTKMWDYIVEHNQLAEDFDWNNVHFLAPCLKIPGLTKEEIVAYIGAAYLHTLKKDFINEIFSLKAPFKFLKVAYLIIKTRKLRGDKFSVYFPKTTNLLLEVWLLIHSYPISRKMEFIRKIIEIEKDLQKNMSSPKVLYISYNASNDSVAQSQVIPYVEKLASYGIDISLVTYEKTPDKGMSEFSKALKERLARSGIAWYRLRYHKRPSLPATIYDILQGIVFVYFLLLRYKFNIIHARQVVPATICTVLRRIIKFKWVFDMRGLFAEESVAHGWKEKGLKFRLVKFMEKSSLLSTDFIIALNRRQKELMSNWTFLSNRDKAIEIIPSCVDLGKFSNVGKNLDLVNRLGLDDKFVLTYLGSLGTCYLLEEMIYFFLQLRKKISNAFFLFVTHGDKELILNAAKKGGLERHSFKVMPSPFDEIPAILSLCDAGIYFINSYMKLSSSPIKFGEYLACGLPVVINSGIGDTGDIVKDHKIGTVVDDLSADAYEHSSNELLELFSERDLLRQRCREAANRYLSLSAGCQRYKEIYTTLCGSAIGREKELS